MSNDDTTLQAIKTVCLAFAFAAAMILSTHVSGNNLSIRWQNPTHNIDETEITPSDRIDYATISAYDEGTLVIQQTIQYPPDGEVTQATLDAMCGGSYTIQMTVTNALGQESSSSNALLLSPEGCSVDPEPVEPAPDDPVQATTPQAPILFSSDGVSTPLFDSGVVNRAGRPTIDWVYPPEPAFKLSEGFVVLRFQVAKSGILVSRAHKYSDRGFQILAQTSAAKPKKEICVQHGGKSACHRGEFELHQPMSVIYEFGPAGASLYINGVRRRFRESMVSGFDADDLPLVIGAGAYDVTGEYPDIDPSELGWWQRGSIQVEIWDVTPPDLQ